MYLSNLNIEILNEKLCNLYKYYPVSTSTEKLKYNKPARLGLWLCPSIKAMILNKKRPYNFFEFYFYISKP